MNRFTVSSIYHLLIVFVLNLLLISGAFADKSAPLQPGEPCYPVNMEGIHCPADHTCYDVETDGEVQRWCLLSQSYNQNSRGYIACGDEICPDTYECCPDKNGVDRCMSGDALEGGKCPSKPCDYPKYCGENQTCCSHNGIGTCVASDILENGACPEACTTRQGQGPFGKVEAPVYCPSSEVCCTDDDGARACVPSDDAPDGSCPEPCSAAGEKIYCRADEICCTDGTAAVLKCITEADGVCPDGPTCGGAVLGEDEQCCDNTVDAWICAKSEHCGWPPGNCLPGNICAGKYKCDDNEVCCDILGDEPGTACWELLPKYMANFSLPSQPPATGKPIPCCNATEGPKACPPDGSCCELPPVFGNGPTTRCVGPDQQCCASAICDKNQKCCFDKCCAEDEECKFTDLAASCEKKPTETPTPVPSSAPKATPTSSPSNSPTPVEETPTPEPTASPAPSPSPSPSPERTETPSPSPAQSPSASPTAVAPTATPMPTATASNTGWPPDPSPTPTQTAAASSSSTATATPSPSTVSSLSPTPTPTISTSSATLTPTRSWTSTATPVLTGSWGSSYGY